MLKWHISRISNPGVFPFFFLRTGSSSGNNFSFDELSVVTVSPLMKTLCSLPTLNPGSQYFPEVWGMIALVPLLMHNNET